jgi:hypothetical protein
MLVSELFEAEQISNDWLWDNMSEQSSYWQSCVSFVNDNWNKEIETMSAKQGAWLTKILDDCVEKRIEGGR